MHELTREMCLELIEYITLDAYVEGQPREIYIYYKLLDEPLKDKRSLFKGVFTLFTQHMKVCYYLARGQQQTFIVIWNTTLKSARLKLLQGFSVASLRIILMQIILPERPQAERQRQQAKSRPKRVTVGKRKAIIPKARENRKGQHYRI